MTKRFVPRLTYVLLLLVTTLVLSQVGFVSEALAAGKWLSDLQQAGRVVTSADWVAYLPPLIVVIVLTLVIDGVVIGVVMRNRRQNRDITQPPKEG